MFRWPAETWAKGRGCLRRGAGCCVLPSLDAEAVPARLRMGPFMFKTEVAANSGHGILPVSHSAPLGGRPRQGWKVSGTTQPRMGHPHGRELQREPMLHSMPTTLAWGPVQVSAGCLRIEDHRWLCWRDSDTGEATSDSIPGSARIRLAFPCGSCTGGSIDVISIETCDSSGEILPQNKWILLSVL